MHMGAPYSTIVEQVNFGSAPLDERGRRAGGPLNRHAEIWMKSKEWLEQACGVQVPDSDKLQADACRPGYCYDSFTRLQLESKEDMRRRGALSPDEWDAVALTFARPVQPSRFHPETGISAAGAGVRRSGRSSRPSRSSFRPSASSARELESSKLGMLVLCDDRPIQLPLGPEDRSSFALRCARRSR